MTSDLLDLHGKQVRAFASQMANLGFARMTDELLGMLDSGAWLEFKDGLGTYQFLPGEFDYFLTQQGVTRDDVMKGVQDLDAKARLERHMDERKTGQADYRRRILEVRQANPTRPGRPIEPFGITRIEAKHLLNGSAGGARADRPALGARVRRYVNTDGRTTKTARDELPAVERVRRAALRLGDDDLADLVDSLKAEQRRRKRDAKEAVGAAAGRSGA